MRKLFFLACTLVGATALAACSSNSTPSPNASATTSTSAAGTASTTASAPCTLAAVTKGARSSSVGTLDKVNSFNCSAGYAIVSATVGPANVPAEQNAANVLLKASGGSWEPVALPHYCSEGLVPPKLYTLACATN